MHAQTKTESIDRLAYFVTTLYIAYCSRHLICIMLPRRCSVGPGRATVGLIGSFRIDLSAAVSPPPISAAGITHASATQIDLGV